MEGNNVTSTSSPQSEPDQDNSSLQNPSTNPAEAGTNDTRDEEHETSSIEALNWSEVEEEELAAAQKAEAEAAAAAAAAALGKENVSPSSSSSANANVSNDKNGDALKKENADGDADKELEKNGSSTNGSGGTVLVTDDGTILSTSLLQSINSTIDSDEDPQARKLSVIENWASEVTNARERGEIEMAEDFPDDSGVTGDDEEEENKNEGGAGVRKRRGKKLVPGMVSSITSSGSNVDSNMDPMSNAPVLDDGPIWNKGPRSYTFQENRRINQKLTFCVLIAVVLAIGLGLGNLVAHQECEAEFKSTQKVQQPSSIHHPPQQRSPVPQTIPTTTPTPIIPDRSTDSSMMGSKLPAKQRLPSIESIEIDNNNNEQEEEDEKPDVNFNVNVKEEEPPKKKDEPIIDPKYKIHAETVSKVVHTLDSLSRKIDQFENTTRKLQGVLMIPDEEEKMEEEAEDLSSLYDKQVYRDDDPLIDVADVDQKAEIDDEDAEYDEILSHMATYELIKQIEQTPAYFEDKRKGKFKKMATGNSDNDDIFKVFDQLNEFRRRFVKTERKRLIDEGYFHKKIWREPDEYTDEEREAVSKRYNVAWKKYMDIFGKQKPKSDEDFTKLLDLLFGAEEELEERTYEDVFPKNPYLDLPDEPQDVDIPENTIVAEEESPSEPSEEAGQTTDDLIILDDTESKSHQHAQTETPPISSGAEPLSSSLQRDDDIIIDSVDNGKSREQPEQLVTPSPEPEVISKDEKPAAVVVDIPEKQKNGSRGQGGPPSSINNRVKRDTSKSSSKSKKHNKKSNLNNLNEGLDTNNSAGKDKAGKRSSEQKQKEQKSKQSKYKKGVQNNNVSGGGGTEAGPPQKTKMSTKSKKLKNLESNKVFENVKGKNYEKRRATPSSSLSGEGSGTGKQQQQQETVASSNSQQNNNDKRNKKQKQNVNSQQYRRNKDEPRYYDPRDIKDQQKLSSSSQQQGSSESEEERLSSEKERATSSQQLKYETHDFSSKETQYRQHKQEFNTNYETRYSGKHSGKSNNGNKKGKNSLSKEKADRGRERATSWGN